MSIHNALSLRSESKCELCGSTAACAPLHVQPTNDDSASAYAMLCEKCTGQISQTQTAEVHHWRCLNESMWSQVPAVQVLAWRMLNALSAEAWARDLLDMLYLNDETLVWAKAGIAEVEDADTTIHKDSNGAVLANGDTVTLIKDLPVKGAGFTAKRGTAVRNISLVPSNENHIEGRVSGQEIVILTAFVKKAT